MTLRSQHFGVLGFDPCYDRGTDPHGEIEHLPDLLMRDRTRALVLAHIPLPSESIELSNNRGVSSDGVL